MASTVLDEEEFLSMEEPEMTLAVEMEVPITPEAFLEVSSGYRVSGFGFWVFGCRVWGSGFGFGVWGFGCGTSCVGIRGSEFWVLGSGFRVSGFEFWVSYI